MSSAQVAIPVGATATGATATASATVTNNADMAIPAPTVSSNDGRDSMMRFALQMAVIATRDIDSLMNPGLDELVTSKVVSAVIDTWFQIQTALHRDGKWGAGFQEGWRAGYAQGYDEGAECVRTLLADGRGDGQTEVCYLSAESCGCQDSDDTGDVEILGTDDDSQAGAGAIAHFDQRLTRSAEPAIDIDDSGVVMGVAGVAGAASAAIPADVAGGAESAGSAESENSDIRSSSSSWGSGKHSRSRRRRTHRRRRGGKFAKSDKAAQSGKSADAAKPANSPARLKVVEVPRALLGESGGSNPGAGRGLDLRSSDGPQIRPRNSMRSRTYGRKETCGLCKESHDFTVCPVKCKACWDLWKVKRRHMDCTHHRGTGRWRKSR